MSSLKQVLRRRLSRRTILLSHRLRAVAANLRYGFPGRGVLVVGVTGTKGKTTSCHFVASILQEAGFTVGMATTVSFQIGDKVWSNDTNMSVTGPFPLQKLLREMRDAHCDALVLEVTSIALDQFRTLGIPFRYVGLTNMSHDHLDYHGTWANYREAKLKLFTRPGLRAAAVNADDPEAPVFLTRTTARERWSYSTQSSEALSPATEHLQASKISTNPEGSSFTLQTSLGESQRVRLQIPGIFNIENALCAAALGLSLNLKLGTVVAGLEAVDHVAGRLERIPTKRGFSVMVDYAHTPDSLEKLYATLRPDVRGRMIAVLGATGDRDRTKRPIMGALAARFCDYVFVTDEEPYTEDPQRIIDEVAKGVPRGRPLFKAASAVAVRTERPIFKNPNESGEGEWWWRVADRREAISRAIDLGKLDDLIIVSGMGAQNYRKVGEKKEPWNERTVIEELLQAKNLL